MRTWRGGSCKNQLQPAWAAKISAKGSKAGQPGLAGHVKVKRMLLSDVQVVGSCVLAYMVASSGYCQVFKVVCAFCHFQDHEYILKPINSQARVKRFTSALPLRSVAKPRITVDLSLDTMAFCLATSQYRSLLLWHREFSRHDRKRKFRKFRPACPVCSKWVVVESQGYVESKDVPAYMVYLLFFPSMPILDPWITIRSILGMCVFGWGMVNIWYNLGYVHMSLNDWFSLL